MPKLLIPTWPSPSTQPSLPARGAIVLLLLLTSACAPLQQKTDSFHPAPPSWPAHRAAMQAIDSWQLKGKLAYRNGENAGSAWFDWTQHGDDFNIFLSGPFGLGTVQINGNAQAITLSQAGEADISASSSSVLTQRLFGWQLPVEQMRHWVRGIPASSSASNTATFNPQGLLDTLQEEGWQLNITRYQTGPKGQLPGKIKGHSGELTFTLLLKEWAFPEREPQMPTSHPDHVLIDNNRDT